MGGEMYGYLRDGPVLLVASCRYLPWFDLKRLVMEGKELVTSFYRLLLKFSSFLCASFTRKPDFVETERMKGTWTGLAMVFWGRLSTCSTQTTQKTEEGGGQGSSNAWADAQCTCWRHHGLLK